MHCKMLFLHTNTRAIEQRVGANLLQFVPMVVDREEEQHVVAKMAGETEVETMARGKWKCCGATVGHV
jgi:hypothetical protein